MLQLDATRKDLLVESLQQQAVEAERLRSGLAAAKVHAAAAEKQSMIREDELKQQIAELRASLTHSKDSEAQLRSQVCRRFVSN